MLTNQSVKRIDPSYMVRGIPPNTADNVYCTQLAHNVSQALLLLLLLLLPMIWTINSLLISYPNAVLSSQGCPWSICRHDLFYRGVS